MKDVKSISDALLAQFYFENPLIENLYTKLDNAGCYHGELVPEALFKVCKTNNFNLKCWGYKFDEKLIDTGNDGAALDLVTASKHRMVYIMPKPLLWILTKTNLEGKKILNLHMYHSIEFKETYMLLQRYYNIGKGVILLYGNVKITSSNNVIVPFTSTFEVSFQHPSKKELIGLCVHYYFSQNRSSASIL